MAHYLPSVLNVILLLNVVKSNGAQFERRKPMSPGVQRGRVCHRGKERAPLSIQIYSVFLQMIPLGIFEPGLWTRDHVNDAFQNIKVLLLFISDLQEYGLL